MGAAFALAAASCASAPPRARTVPAESSSDDTPQSAEWLYVTGSGQAAPKVECDKVADYVIGEKKCTSELCEHARDLGKEWFQRCGALTPTRKQDVAAMVEEAARRTQLPGDPCVQEGSTLMRTNECGKPEACVAKAQKWVAHCGERYATPLILLILTRTAERRFHEPTVVELDKRSCGALREQVRAGVGCDGEQGCKVPSETASAFLERCIDGAVPVETGIGIADVLVGAGRSVDPIGVEAEPERLADGSFPLLLKDGLGTAVWACGERPRDVASYVAVRQKCSPGEVIFTCIRKSRQVSTVSVPHSSDSEFSRLFPFLELRGEREARDSADLEGFKRKLREAAARAHKARSSEVIGMVTSVLLPRVAMLVRDPDHQAALSEIDAEFAPVLRELGRLKAKAAARLRDPIESALFAGRSLHNPLSDTRADGSVLPGSFAAPRGLALSQWMPVSFAAYRKELGAFEKAVKKTKREPIERLPASLAPQISACAAAATATQTAESAAERCLFETPNCTSQQAEKVAAASEADRQRGEAAQRAISLVLSSGLLTADQVEKIESQKVAEGCID